MKKRSIILALGLVIILIAATIIVVPMIRDNNSNDSSSDQNDQIVEDTTDQDNTTADNETDNTQDPTQDNTPDSNIPDEKPSAEIEVPPDVQEIINEHQEELYDDSANLLAADYPSELIPLYNATTVSESQLITSASGNPGWLTSYVSQNSTEELANFYRSLLSGMSNFTEEAVSATTNFSATSGAYSINISVSPNIQEKTDLPGNSAASIYIEQTN